MLFLALVFAAALAEYRRAAPKSRAAWIPLAALGLIAFEFFPRPVPTFDAAVPALFDRLGDRPDGAMLPVPMGAIFNGISGQGAIGNLYVRPSDQAHYRKPIIGGYLGRASPRVLYLMTHDALLSPLLDAQAGGAVISHLKDRAFAGRWLRGAGVRYVLVETALTPAPLRDAIAKDWPVRLIDRDGPLELYELGVYNADAAGRKP